MKTHDSVNFEIRLSGRRDRIIKRGIGILALVALALGVYISVRPARPRTPAAPTTSALAAEAVEFGATSVDVYDQCGDWLGLPAGERLRGARHLLISLRHAAGVEAPGDYTPPVDSVTRRLLDDMRVDCLDGLDGDTIVAQLAMRAYRTDGALRS